MPRIVAGRFGGRRIAAPRGQETRPTSEKAREGTFATLQGLLELEGALVWDLYAGSGALGLEALSRGAGHAVFVEAARGALQALRSNLKALGLRRDAARLEAARVERWLAGAAGEAPPALVLMDPPYEQGAAQRVLGLLAGHPALQAGALVVVEAAAREALEPPAALETVRVKRYGEAQVWFLRKT